MFVTDWQDWKNNIRRFLVLSAVNFVLFFILGAHIFIDFLEAIIAQSVYPSIWIGNHSIRSFVSLLSINASEYGWTWIYEYSGLVQTAFLAMITVCIFVIILQAYRQKQNGINSVLLLACTIGTLLIPSVSHDYKLSILAAPVAILFSDLSSFSKTDLRPRLRLVMIVLIFVFSATYSSTLFSFTNKPFILHNNLPALVTMLLAITCLSIMSKPGLNGKEAETKKAKDEIWEK